MNYLWLKFFCSLCCSKWLLILLTLSKTGEAAAEIELPAINMSMHALATDSITIAWNYTDPSFTIIAWQVTAVDISHSEFMATYEGSANIDLDNRIATVMVHQHNRAYNVCLVGFYNRSLMAQLGTDVIEECGIFKTIPLLLQSSLIPLIIVVSFFISLVLLGALTYKIKQLQLAQHQYKKTDTSSETNNQNGLNKNNHSMRNHIEA